MSPSETREGGSRPGRRLAVIGAGYVGLPTAAVLGNLGHRIVCAEANPRRLEMLSRGEVPIVEDGLADLVAQAVSAGNLRFVGSASEAVAGAGIVFLCVPTPQGNDGSADLSFIEAAAAEIAPHLADGAIVVNKSTVPVGTAALVERIANRPDVRVVSNPEFLREGTAVHDSLHPERIVIGAEDQSAAAEVAELFEAIGAPLVLTDTVTAETIKYASNAFLATKLSFVNAVAMLCEAIGADVGGVIRGLGYDHRIGFEYLSPGPGWGGSCLPKDTRALVRMAEQVGYDFALLRGAISANEDHLAAVVEKVVSAAGGSVSGTKLGIWGLTFKAGTDDRRDSPAVEICRRLIGRGARIQGYDPTVVPAASLPDLEGMTICADPYEASRGAAVVVLLTEWDEFRRLDFSKVRDLMAGPKLVDARNLLDPATLRRVGFSYQGIGRR